MTERLVIYHGNCFDGFTAAWVLHNHGAWKDATFYPAFHGAIPPWELIQGRDIIIVDFSYKRKLLDEVFRLASSLRVWDHHASAKADLAGLPYCVFDMERSGAGLAWDMCKGLGTPRPWLVDMVEDRDLWRFRFPTTKACTAYMASQPYSYENWDTMQEMGRAACAAKGFAIMDYIAQYGRNALENQRHVRFNGWVDVPTINVQYMNCSEHLHELLMANPDAPFVVGYFCQGDGQWRLSFRCREDFDVSAVAETFGGGGHKKAAGAIVPILPWMQDDSWT
jgi:oligoribonuclease NrnB/cAMP/cGMP phosphodiesterase (DHH superfamily)